MDENINGAVWDLTSYFPRFNAAEMIEFKQKLQQDLAEIKRRAGRLKPLDETNSAHWQELILLSEAIASRLGHIVSYIECLEAAHADDEAYAREKALLLEISAEFEKFEVDLQQAFKASSDTVFKTFSNRKAFKDAGHWLRRTRQRARHSMQRDQELLATDLNITGMHAWGRLYDRLSGKLQFDMTYPDGKIERKPISQWRTLMSDVDRILGKAAFEGGNRAWRTIEDSCAAALNAIAGARLTLYAYRGIEHFLDMALFQASIERQTLDAMYQAIHENLEIAREIFRVRARFLGRDGIWFFEREAPLPLADFTRFTWLQGTKLVGRAFDAAYPELAVYFRTLLEKKWIESESRPGKRPGAFCTDSTVTGEQRIFMTFNGSPGDVTTLAHEVGHAWHGHLMRDMRPLAQHYPMTLAETASIFAEHILAQGIYSDSGFSNHQKLHMLDADLSGAAVMLLDITTRFEFERAFYQERGLGEVPVSRLKQLMVDTQKNIFGDVLLPDGADPYFWASKLHFYMTDVTFYNFPYTFGFLLARSLANMFHEKGKEFLPKYETFLKLAGSDSVENVALQSLGVDISQSQFWSGALRSLETPLAHYKKLLEN